MPTLRFGAPADLAVLVPLWYAMLEECGLLGAGTVPDWRERLTAQFSRDMEQGTGVWFLAEEAGEIAGTCTVFRQGGRSQILLEETGMLAGMYVLPAYRGRGIARSLLEWALAWARSEGMHRMRLNASAAGRPLYESLGFVTATEMMRLDL